MSEWHDISTAKATLHDACVLYCAWYDGKMKDHTGGSIAYELVSMIRRALSELPSPSPEPPA